jgi:hypothetical protein
METVPEEVIEQTGDPERAYLQAAAQSLKDIDPTLDEDELPSRFNLTNLISEQVSDRVDDNTFISAAGSLTTAAGFLGKADAMIEGDLGPETIDDIAVTDKSYTEAAYAILARLPQLG